MLVNPSLVVLGGGVTRAGDALLAAVDRRQPRGRTLDRSAGLLESIEGAEASPTMTRNPASISSRA
jgi:hypothetical protein